MNNKADEIVKRRSQLSPAKQALLEKRLRGEERPNSQKIVISPRAQQSPAPLSLTQQGLWFFQQLESQSSVYNEFACIQLKGILNLAALEKSLNEIIRRHESLRTCFEILNEQPVQVIHPTWTIELPVVNLSNLPQALQNAKVEQLTGEIAQKAFDLASSPLLRAMLLQIGEQEHLLLLVIHHIICDGWSIQILNQELAVLYESFCAEKSSPLSELPIQYADYSIWQRDWLQGERETTQLCYWKQQLADAPTTLALPTDRQRPPVQSFQGATSPFELSPRLTSMLKSLSNQQGVTLFMTLLAAFQAQLYRYTNQEDICLGSPIANRNHTNIEGLIGFFVNTLVLRTDLSRNPSFLELLGRVREVCVGAYAHTDIPFERVVAELHPERNLSHTPLFQVMFALQEDTKKDLVLPGLTLKWLDNHSQTAKFDLTLFVMDAKSELWGFWEYNTDLFDAATIERMNGHLINLLEAIVTDPHKRLSDLPLLTNAEQQTLLGKWNDTTTNYSEEKCIHELFEVQVEKTPDAVAVVFEEEQLTYRELNVRANQLAHYLQALGVKPEVLVGLCTQRSIEMIIGLLAILKAGGAYVPIDPTYPQQRLALVLNDAQIEVLLTQQHLLAKLPAHTAKVVCLDEIHWQGVSSAILQNPVNQTTQANLAYVIYTSGSTGTPKAVTIQHQSLVNFVQAAITEYELQPEDRILQFASISFDAACEEIFPCLLHGATLVLRTDEMLVSIKAFNQKCQQHCISVLDLPTAFWHQLTSELATLASKLPESLRLVIIGGEKALPDKVNTWRQQVPGIRLINSYGPTETTVVATVCDLATVEAQVPIGKAIANVQTYVLDSDLQPVPIGIWGELYVGGIGVARGYLHQPELTAQKFIPNPFSERLGSRLYKTGDRVRYRNDGQIEFTSRVDNQVKIRGFRIELGEIEALLDEHPYVREATVIPHKDVSESQQLVAYVVANTSDVVKGQTSAVDLNTQQASQWQAVFDSLYNELDLEQQSGFYIKGWESSYTGLHLPDEQVREWMEQTVERISALQPTQILEIGCGGSGLMLLHFAPDCTQYCATDISQNALNILQQQLSNLGQDLSAVSFIQKGADDFTGMSTDSFDAVFIVSVAQYFPSIDYLLKVLEGAVNVVQPGGFIFLGDVRNFSLLEAFHTSVQLHKAPASLSVANLQQRVQKQIFAEKQLVIDPAFFIALKQHLPKISHVEIHLERGHFHNELTKFRYDVIIHVEHDNPLVDISWLDWQQAKLTLGSVRELLIETQPDILGIVNVPNARVLADVKAVELLKNSQDLTNVSQLHQALQAIATTGIDPEELWALSEELPYTVDISWSDESVNGEYKVVFKSRTIALQMKPIVVAPPCTGKTTSYQAWSDYANTPLQQMSNTQVVSLLRQHLEEKLPNYMLPAAFVLLEALPLTPNGKIDRKALPEPDRIRPELEETYIAPQTSVEKQLALIWAQVLGLEKVGINDKFFELGGDSILSLQVISKANLAGLHLTPKQLFQHQTIAQLATVVSSNISISAEQGSVTGSFPLTPIQRWFFEENFSNPDYYNQAVLLEVQQALNPVILEQVVNYLLQHHDLLRSQFIQESSRWQARIEEFQQVAPVTVIDLSTLPPESQSAAITATCSELQASLNLSGQLLQVASLNLGVNQHSRLFIVIHHLVVDGVSWRILLEDLQTAYTQLSQGETIKLPPKTTSFKQWAEQLQQYAQSAPAEAEIDYWLQPRQPCSSLPVDYPGGNNTISSTASVTVTLSATETQALLQDVPAAYRTQINDVLLLALVQTFAKWTGQTTLLLDLEGHGREEILTNADISRTIGWFTSIFPIVLSIEKTNDPGEALKMVKEQLRQIPNRGIGYGVLYYLNENPGITGVLRSLPKPEVSFNYLGQLDQVLNTSSMFKFASESDGSNQSDRHYRSHLLEIDSSIISGQLKLQWRYSHNLHKQSTVETLAQEFIEALRSIIAHCQSPEAAGFTPSDFPLTQLNQAELDLALQQISF
ncbi:non-ribosomal peptide synthetase [Nostoc sp. PA-18-2419]|uniref:non-ribosomal peptide synthetase n=1 Tax=Nostoc sp. PA-18-2419 TaxID=2575443 RepID=UPI001107F680|nr:non-ribosomal peptide synthetase [Nostoc sp. PA-18-2419]